MLKNKYSRSKSTITNRDRILANTIYCVKNVRIVVLSRYGTVVGEYGTGSYLHLFFPVKADSIRVGIHCVRTRAFANFPSGLPVLDCSEIFSRFELLGIRDTVATDKRSIIIMLIS